MKTLRLICIVQLLFLSTTSCAQNKKMKTEVDKIKEEARVLKKDRPNFQKYVSKEDISILINYLKTDKLDNYANKTMLETTCEPSSKQFHNILKPLREHKKSAGEELEVLIYAEKISAEIGSNK